MGPYSVDQVHDLLRKKADIEKWVEYHSNNVEEVKQDENLAKLAKEKKIGVVCSGQEAKTVRKILGPNLLIFTPGVRMEADDKNDQSPQRVCTPIESCHLYTSPSPRD